MRRLYGAFLVYRCGYARTFEYQSGLRWPEVLERARSWQRLIEDDFPEPLAEMTGVAAGAGVTLNEIRETLGVSLVFVTHDLAVVGQVTDELLVMYRGSAVEQGATAEVLRRPTHPYTEMLLSSAPGPDWRPERVAELRAAFQEAL